MAGVTFSVPLDVILSLIAELQSERLVLRGQVEQLRAALAEMQEQQPQGMGMPVAMVTKKNQEAG